MMAAQLAKVFADARRTGSAIPTLPHIASQEQAFEVQKYFLEHTDVHGLGPKVGWKCAGVTLAAIKSLGLSGPGRAPIFAAQRFSSGQIVPCGPADTPGNFFVVEAEFGFIMKDSLPQRATPYAVEEVWAAVDGMVPTFELVGSRTTKAGQGKQSGFQFVADNANNYGVVIGPKVGKAALPHALAPEGPLEARKQMKVELIRNGQVLPTPKGFGTAADNVAEKPGTNEGGPFWSLFWLANHLASGQHGGTLAAGDVIIPGAGAITRTVEFGDHIVARFDGLGTVEMTIGAGSPNGPTLFSRL